MKKKKKTEIKVTYQYVEPKTKEEAQETERRLQAAFDMLFEETLGKVLVTRTSQKD